MADEDWDLYAVVRSCNSTAASNTSPSIPNTLSASSSNSTCQDPLPSLASLALKEEENYDQFSFNPNPNSSNFQELQQLCTPFIPTTITATTTSGSGISSFGGSTSQFQNQLTNIVQQPQNPNTNINVGPHFMADSPSSTLGFSDQKPPQVMTTSTHVQDFQISPTHSMGQSQAPRSRKRKSQHKRMVCHVTAENLSSDMWAWRKYGQKPIKGSPYPRNYYRCSSSKGCVARKQVERSNNDPDIFIVTYTGEHSHPRPTHRNSLAGSTRNNKLSVAQKMPGKEEGLPGNDPVSSSPPLSMSSLSPNTPVGTAENEEVCKESEIREMEMELEDDDDEDELLIPNMAAMAEDLFMGLRQLISPVGSTSSCSPAGEPVSSVQTGSPPFKPE